MLIFVMFIDNIIIVFMFILLFISCLPITFGE